MAATFPTFRHLITALDEQGELKRISDRVSPVLEIAAITDRVSKSPAPRVPSAAARRNDPRFHGLGGHALLFENVEGSEFPVAINTFGSYSRMELALGCAGAMGGFDAIGARIAQLVKPEPPKSLREMIGKARQFLPLLRTPPKRRRGSGLCQEVVITGDKIDVTRLPIIRCWPLDGDFAALGYPAGVNDGVPGLERSADWEQRFRGRYITLGGIHTIHADDAGSAKPSSHNIGMYRVQVLGRDRLAMHWHMHHDGARHWRSWKARGESMPVAIALGGESVLPYAATAPLPPGISELLLAGFLNGSGIEMVRARTVPLWVPGNAEMVIEGFVSHEAGLTDYDPTRDGAIGPGAVFEGPFGDHTGFYSLPDRYPVLTVTAITHRRAPIYPTTIVGLPPQEDYFLGKATERIFLPLLKTLIPDIEDYDLPLFGAFHNCAFVKVRKQYPLHARRVMHAIWGAGQMSWTKSIFIMDHDVDVHDTTAVLRSAAEFCDPQRDIERIRGPLDILDHAAPYLGAGTKFGLDCTKKIDGEQVGVYGLAESLGHDRRIGELGARSRGWLSLTSAIDGLPGVLDVQLHCAGWLIVRINKSEAGQGSGMAWAIESLAESHGPLPSFVVIVGSDADARDIDDALFHWLAHADAGRDAQLIRSGDSGRQTLVFDSTPKLASEARNGEPVRAWPPILRMDDTADVRAQVILRAVGLESPFVR